MNRKPTSDRYKGLFISYNFMMRMICGEAIITNIPDWTRLVECHHDFMRRGFVCIIEHPSFPKVEEGKEPEFLCAEFKVINPPSGTRKLTFE